MYVRVLLVCTASALFWIYFFIVVVPSVTDNVCGSVLWA